MKYKIAIEETVVGEFTVEAESAAEALCKAEENYHKGKFVLEPGEVQSKQMAVLEPEEEKTEWREF